MPHTAQCRVCLTEKPLRDSSRCIERRNGLHLHELLVQTWSLPSSWSRSVRALSRSRGRSVAQAGGGENLLALKRYTWFLVGGGTGNWALSVFQTPECISHRYSHGDIHPGRSIQHGWEGEPKDVTSTLPGGRQPRFVLQFGQRQQYHASIHGRYSVSLVLYIISRGSPLSRAYKA